MTSYTGQTVLVTGASRGIGFALATRYAQLGAAVGLVARDAGRLTRAAGTLRARTHTVAADLSDPGECRRAVAEIESALGAVDVLVCCAGGLTRDFVEDVAVEDFEHEYRLHVGSPLWLSQAVLPDMRARRRGRIVLVGSELGLIGAPTYASYCSSKWAALGLAEVLQHELVGSGVHVVAVCPGDVRTDQLAEEEAWGPTGGQPYAKAMDPRRVARAIVRAGGGSRRFVVIDRPLMNLAFRMMAGPRRMRFGPVHAAYEELLRERAPGSPPATAEHPPVSPAAARSG